MIVYKEPGSIHSRKWSITFFPSTSSVNISILLDRLLINEIVSKDILSSSISKLNSIVIVFSARLVLVVKIQKVLSAIKHYSLEVVFLREVRFFSGLISSFSFSISTFSSALVSSSDTVSASFFTSGIDSLGI